MAFGNPVIGPNYGAPADLIRHGETGLTVDPEDPAAVAKALLYLLTSPDEAKRMGASASRWVRQEYSFDLFCRRLGDLLFELDYIDRVQQNRAAALESTWVDHGGSAGGNP